MNAKLTRVGRIGGWGLVVMGLTMVVACLRETPRSLPEARQIELRGGVSRMVWICKGLSNCVACVPPSGCTMKEVVTIGGVDWGPACFCDDHGSKGCEGMVIVYFCDDVGALSTCEENRVKCGGGFEPFWQNGDLLPNGEIPCEFGCRRMDDNSSCMGCDPK